MKHPDLQLRGAKGVVSQGGSVKTRGLPEDGVCPLQAENNCTPLISGGDHHCWCLGKGR